MHFDISVMGNSMGSALFVTDGRVFDLDGDVHQPDVTDISLFVPGSGGLHSRKAVPELGGTPPDEIIDARGKLIVPGLVNAHYHSDDVLLKGCFEAIPLELWFSSALPPA
jgi:5-methylthioadenosine/S-adenosylhomocysteine deaminase